MKQIKTLAIVALTMIMALPAQAQYGRYGNPRGGYGRTTHRVSSSPYTYFGFRGGIVGGTLNSDNSYFDASSMKSGLNVGFNADILLTPATPLFFETGLQYTEKGGKMSYSGNKLTYNLNYLEVPLLLKYQYKLDRNLALTPFLGGYLACGVGGKIKDQATRTAESAFSDYNFRRFDGGIRLGCGLMVDMLYLEIGYDAGLANISQDSFDSTHTGALFANLGINF
ncbi:MAG: PorT family protein [Prevotella sp.]|nr:PorT family protein [Prevotella sp.]